MQDRDGVRLLLRHLPGSSGVTPQENQETCIAAPLLEGRTHLQLTEPFTPTQQKLQASRARINKTWVYIAHDPYYVEATNLK